MMTPAEEERAAAQRLSEAMIRLEAKIDVVLSQHEGKIDDLMRRQGETSSTLREYDGRITANALTIAETRAQSAAAISDVKLLRNDVTRDVTEAKQLADRAVAEAKREADRAITKAEQLVADSKPKNIPVWIAIGISALAVVLSPMLSALITH